MLGHNIISPEQPIHRTEHHILVALVTSDNSILLKNKQCQVIDKRRTLQTLTADTFKNEDCKFFLMAAKKFINEHGKIPTLPDVFTYIRLWIKEDFTKEDFNPFTEICASDYTQEMLFTIVDALADFDSLNAMINELLMEIKKTTFTIENVKHQKARFRSMIDKRLSRTILAEDNGISVKKAKDHMQKQRTCKSTGDPYLDLMTDGGWSPGLWVLSGQPKIGKSTVMGHIAVSASNAGGNVGIATLELGSDKYMKRIGSNLLNIPIKEYRRYVKGSNDETLLVDELERAIDKKRSANPEFGDIIIKDFPIGNTTSEDIRDFFIREEERSGVKFSVIIVDYLSLMEAVNNGKIKKDSNMYLKLKEIGENLRNVALANEWPIVTPIQLKPEFWDKTEAGQNSLEESSATTKTLDGLIQIFPTVDEDTGKATNTDKISLNLKLIRDAEPIYIDTKFYYTKDKTFFRLVPEKTEQQMFNAGGGGVNAKSYSGGYNNNNSNQTSPYISQYATTNTNALEAQEALFLQEIKPNLAFDQVMSNMEMSDNGFGFNNAIIEDAPF